MVLNLIQKWPSYLRVELKCAICSFIYSRVIAVSLTVRNKRATVFNLQLFNIIIIEVKFFYFFELNQPYLITV